MRALVTGASQGIGGATCRHLVAAAKARGEDAAVVMTVRSLRPDVEALAEELQGQGARTLILTAELSDPETPARLVAAAVAFAGGLDTVVSNAGIQGPGPLAALSLDSWQRVFDVNVRATWLLAKAAYPALCDSRGALVAVSSMSGVEPHAGTGAYSASKAALIMLCRQLAQEWGPQGIRVNAVSPGMTRTPLTARIYENDAVAAQRNDLVPMKRVATPDDVAEAIAFLARAAHVTGENLRVDGGFSSSILSHVPGLPPAAQSFRT